MHELRNRINTGAAAIVLAATCQLEGSIPVQAAATGDEIVAAIDSEHILSAGAKINVQVKDGIATVSAFRHAKANDNDLKIDAVLMSRAIMNLDAKITRVIFYFFSSADLSKYKQTTVSTGDVKAFAGGQIKKDELLASLPFEAKKIEDANAKVENAMQAGETVGVGQRLESAISGNEIDVSTDLDPSASLRDMKFAALQIAERALSAAPPNIKTVKIAFADPSQPGALKNIVLDTAMIKAVNASVQAVFSKIPISAGATAGPAGQQVVPGVLQKERQARLDQINDLAKNGVGIGVIKGMFDLIEQSVTGGAPESQLTPLVQKLAVNLDALTKANKAAKAMQTAKGSAPSGPPPKVRLSRTRLSRWAFGIEPVQDGSILSDSAGYLAEIERRLAAVDAAKNLRVDDDKRFHDGLQYFVQVLSQDPSKQSQVVEIQRRIARIQQRHPEF